MSRSSRRQRIASPVIARAENNNYLMTSYDQILTTGDNVENNIIAETNVISCRSFKSIPSWILKILMRK
jgi:hypothetical protein